MPRQDSLLKAGIKLKSLDYIVEEDLHYLEAGINAIKSITIIEIDGLHSTMPWAEVIHDSGKVELYNCAGLLSVRLEV